jgi:DNA polymerase III subunit delta'
MSELYAWQEDIWRRYMPAAASGHHALLIRGPRGVGKLRLARTIARGVLCQRPTAGAMPCGACSSCTWIEQGQHPDLLWVEPRVDEDESEAESAQSAGPAKKSLPLIKIDQIREVVEALALSTHQGGRRVVLLHPAESMNAHAANALLKTLEEPAPGTLFLLVCHRRGLLPATIVSRCRAIDLALPPPALAAAWLREQGVQDADNALALAGGAPLLALEKATPDAAARRAVLLAALKLGARIEPVEQAERIKQLSTAEIVDTLQTWSHDLLALKLGQGARYHLDCSDAQAKTAAHARLESLLALQRKLLHAKRLAHHPLNARLAAEDLLLAYRGACTA